MKACAARRLLHRTEAPLLCALEPWHAGRMPTVHPCQTCGACCAWTRVVLHRRQVDRHGGCVPAALTEPRRAEYVTMKGTTAEKPRCIALSGTIGEHTACTIYTRRPEECREFVASWENGEHNKYCDEARAGQGLPPLTYESWRAVD